MIDANTAVAATAAEWRMHTREAWIDVVDASATVYALQTAPLAYTDAVADAQVRELDWALSVRDAAQDVYSEAHSVMCLAEAATFYDWNRS